MIKTPAFVIKKYDFREFDRTYIIYTKELGKISLFVRGARRIKSKLSPSLENFNEVKVNFIKGRIFNHLAGASTIIKNNYILKDSNKITLVYDCLNLLDRFVKPEERDDDIYDLVSEMLTAINSNVIASPVLGARQSRDLRDCVVVPPRNDEAVFPKIHIYFFWRLIDLLGYRPQLDACALCNSTLSRDSRLRPAFFGTSGNDRVGDKLDLFFNITDNIIICRKCAPLLVIPHEAEQRGAEMRDLIKEDTLEKLRQVFRVDLKEFLNFDLDNQLIGITNKAKQIKLSEL